MSLGEKATIDGKVSDHWMLTFRVADQFPISHYAAHGRLASTWSFPSDLKKQNIKYALELIILARCTQIHFCHHGQRLLNHRNPDTKGFKTVLLCGCCRIVGSAGSIDWLPASCVTYEALSSFSRNCSHPYFNQVPRAPAK